MTVKSHLSLPAMVLPQRLGGSGTLVAEIRTPRAFPSCRAGVVACGKAFCVPDQAFDVVAYFLRRRGPGSGNARWPS